MAISDLTNATASLGGAPCLDLESAFLIKVTILVRSVDQSLKISES